MSRRLLTLGVCLLATTVVSAQEEAASGETPANLKGVRRQYVGRPVAGVPLAQPAVVAPVGQCPGGPSLPIECDPKRPWPQCPPQSYCYATNSVDIGPYFCCPIWSTYGAAWRPATPFYNYVPPPPPNWGPELGRLVANWPAAAVGMPPAGYGPIKAKKQQNFEKDESKSKIEDSINGWLERQSKAAAAAAV